MAIFLVQHGVNLQSVEDSEKGLSEKGRTDTKKIADVAKIYDIPVLKIVHSGKKRAEQTACIFKETFGIKTLCEKIDTINPLDDVIRFSKDLDPDLNMMVVGHLPFMERLVSFLTTGSTDMKVYKFQNSGIVCLDQDEDETWFIKWTLNPDIS